MVAAFVRVHGIPSTRSKTGTVKSASDAEADVVAARPRLHRPWNVNDYDDYFDSGRNGYFPDVDYLLYYNADD